MISDKKSNQQQIIQSVLDEANQALKVTAVGGTSGSDLTDIDGNPVETGLGTPGSGSLRVAAMLGVGSTAVSSSNPVPIVDGTRTFQAAGSVLASTTTISTAPVTVVTNGLVAVNHMQVMNSCNVTLRLIINSVDSIILMPSSAVEVPLAVGASQVVAVRREGPSDATTGYVVVNLFS